MKTLKTITLCDICYQKKIKKEAKVDGKTNFGPWANMCQECFKKFGIGLGLGKGQEL